MYNNNNRSRQQYNPMDPFSMMDSFFSNSMLGLGGVHGNLSGFGGMNDMFSNTQSFSNGGNGSFSSQTVVYSSNMGPNGQQHVTRYAKSSVGDGSRQLMETHEAYQDSRDGLEKYSSERRQGSDGHKMIRERNINTGDAQQRDYFHGSINDQNVSQFNSMFNQNRQTLPSHNTRVLQSLQNGQSNRQVHNSASFHQAPTHLGGSWDDFTDFSGGGNQQPRIQNNHNLNRNMLHDDNRRPKHTVQIEEVTDDDILNGGQEQVNHDQRRIDHNDNNGRYQNRQSQPSQISGTNNNHTQNQHNFAKNNYHYGGQNVTSMRR